MVRFPFSLFSKRSVSAFLEIGNSSVAGMIISVSGTEKKILYFKRMEIEPPTVGEPDFGKIFDALLTIARDLLRDMRTVSGHSPQHIYCSLSSPWYSAVVHHAEGGQDKDFKVEEKTVDMLIDSEIKALVGHIEKNKQTGREETEVMDARAVRIRLNGYDTPDPYGKIAHNVEIQILAVMASKHILESIEKTTRTIFPKARISFNSFTLLGFLALRNMWPAVKDFLLIDVTAEATDIVCCRDNGIVASVVLPVGKRTLLSEDKPVALEKTKKTAPSPAYNAPTEFSSLFQGAVKEFSATLPVPAHVFLVAHPSIAPQVSQEITEAGKNGDTPLMGEGFEITILTEPMFTPFFSSARGLSPDIFILLGALGFNALDRPGGQLTH